MSVIREFPAGGLFYRGVCVCVSREGDLFLLKGGLVGWLLFHSFLVVSGSRFVIPRDP